MEKCERMLIGQEEPGKLFMHKQYYGWDHTEVLVWANKLFPCINSAFSVIVLQFVFLNFPLFYL